MGIHNHENASGLRAACPEYWTAQGQLVGECMSSTSEELDEARARVEANAKALGVELLPWQLDYMVSILDRPLHLEPMKIEQTSKPFGYAAYFYVPSVLRFDGVRAIKSVSGG